MSTDEPRMPGPQPLGPDERDELARLRAEVTVLHAQVAGGRPGRWARRGRWLGACLVLLLAAVTGGIGIVAGFARGQVLDTDTYVETVAPLLDDPAVQDAVAHRLADEIVARTDVTGLATKATDALVQQGVPPAVTG